MTTVRSKFLMSLIAGTFALTASAGQEKGNGGDAVVMNDGRLVLFDFYERGVDADAWMEKLHDSKQAYPYGIYATGETVQLYGPDFMRYGDSANEIKRNVSLVLGTISARFPGLVVAITEEARKLRWAKAAATIVPNPDTQPFIDPSQFKRIGCARNISQQILYSPECGSDRMSPAQKAGLVLHEIIYSLYRRARPDSDNSFNVRTIVSNLFDDPDFHYEEFEDVLNDTGLTDIVAMNDAINQTFYRSPNLANFSTYLDCHFDANKRHLKSLRLDFAGAMRVRGELRSTDKRKLLVETVDGWEQLPRNVDHPEPSDRVWRASIPHYDLDQRRMSFGLWNSGAGAYRDETLKTQIRFSDDSTHEIEITYVTFIHHDEEVSYTITGTCRQYADEPAEYRE